MDTDGGYEPTADEYCPTCGADKRYGTEYASALEKTVERTKQERDMLLASLKKLVSAIERQPASAFDGLADDAQRIIKMCHKGEL